MAYAKQLGFDVAEVCGATFNDFQEMVNRGAKFVAIRSSYGLHSKDEMFEQYCSYADQLGLEKMAYHYSYAKNADEAAIEAENCRNVIANSGVGLSIVWYDIEEYPEPSTDKARAFLDNIGLNCGIYANYNFLTNYIDWQSLGCPVWNAQYSSVDDIGAYMWQFQGDVPVIDGSVDLNYRYIPE